MEERAISLPFTIVNGKVGDTTNQAKIWEDRVRSVIGTAVKERVMRPAFGTMIPNVLWDNEANVISAVEQEVRVGFAHFLPLLALTKVKVDLDINSGEIHAEIVYRLPNSKQVSTNIGLLLLLEENPPYQELS